MGTKIGRHDVSLYRAAGFYSPVSSLSVERLTLSGYCKYSNYSDKTIIQRKLLSLCHGKDVVIW